MRSASARADVRVTSSLAPEMGLRCRSRRPNFFWMYDSASAQVEVLGGYPDVQREPPYPFIVCGVGGSYQAEVGRTTRARYA